MFEGIKSHDSELGNKLELIVANANPSPSSSKVSLIETTYFNNLYRNSEDLERSTKQCMTSLVGYLTYSKFEPKSEYVVDLDFSDFPYNLIKQVGTFRSWVMAVSDTYKFDLSDQDQLNTALDKLNSSVQVKIDYLENKIKTIGSMISSISIDILFNENYSPTVTSQPTKQEKKQFVYDYIDFKTWISLHNMTSIRNFD